MRTPMQVLVLGVLLMVPMACGEATETPGLSPTAAATLAETYTPPAISPTQVTATVRATVTRTATRTPSPTPTWDATRIAGMTLEAIRVAVTASGVPEGSTEFEAQVAATRCALIPPPTATPMPWRLAPEEPYLVSVNCLGSDLPGKGVRLWQEDVWIEANQYEFADPADLEAPRQSFLAYLGLISFAVAPPGDDFEVVLAEYMTARGNLPSPESCLAHEVSSQVLELAQQDLYVRLTFSQPIEWNAPYYLYVSPVGIELALPWSTGPVLQELFTKENETPLRRELLAGLAGTARLNYDLATGRWYLTDDEGGYYCQMLPLFLN